MLVCPVDEARWAGNQLFISGVQGVGAIWAYS